MRHLCAALAAVAFGLAAMCVAAPASADITVDVNQAAVQPLPIAITAFAGSPVGAQISGVVAAD
jgi:TolB protein